MTTFLKKLRQEQDISQEFLAEKIGVSRPTYAQIESGARDMSVKEAQKLARFFGLSLENFLAGKKIPESKVELEKSKKPKIQKLEMRVSVPQEKVKKFKEVLLYILERIGARPNIGEAVVCKLMYFIDFDYYEKFEEQLIGAKYIKNHFGPTPVAFPEIVAQMEQDGDLTRVAKKYFQHEQKKYLPRRSADLSNFSAQEKELIDWEIERFKDFNATKMRDYSHKDVPWIGADDLQPINYEAVFSRTDEFSVRQYDNEL
ncbi:MAG: type II toxin-antitoxin system antitoxin SocA domain-containing protein [bacterium]